MLHRRESFRAIKIMLERAIAHPNIELRTNTVVEEVLGVEDNEVKGVRLRDVTNGATSELEVERGVSWHRARAQRASMFAGQIDLDGEGYIRTQNNVFTTHTALTFPASMPAAMCRTGAIARPSPPPGTGCMAALEVEKYLEEHGH